MPEADALIGFALGVVLATAVWIGLALWACHPAREHDERRRADDDRDEHEEVTHG